MMYVLLVLVPLILCIFAIKIYKGDFLSPTIVSFVCFLIAIICSVVGLIDWNYNKELSYDCFSIVIMGLLMFSLGELLVRILKNDKSNNDTKEYKGIEYISKIVLLLMLLFIIITTVLLVFEIKKICEYYGFYDNSFARMLSYYRNTTALFNGQFSVSIQINFIIKQMQKISNAIHLIVFTYGISLFFKNLKNKVSNKKYIFDYIIIALIVLCGLFQTILFNGGRSILFHYLIAYLGLSLYIYFYIFKFKIKNIKRAVGFVFSFGIIMFLVFNLLLFLVGRANKNNAITYTSFSLGTSIPSFDIYLSSDNSKSNNYGEETFRGIYYTLNKFGVIDYKEPETHEWIAFADDGSLSSNTYTSLRSYYKDFGIIGVLVLQFIFGIAMYIFYSIIKNKKNELLIIIYFNYFYILFDQIRDEQFFSLINISTIANIIIIILVYYSLFLTQKIFKKERMQQWLSRKKLIN